MMLMSARVMTMAVGNHEYNWLESCREGSQRSKLPAAVGNTQEGRRV